MGILGCRLRFLLYFFISSFLLNQLGLAGWAVKAAKIPDKDGVALGNRWNWTVSLQKSVKAGPWHPTSYFHQCVGSVISENWILTAAHCFNGYGNDDVTKYRVVSGTHDLRATPTEQKKKIQRIVRHPSFRGRPSTFDLALVQLSTPFKLGGQVTKVDLHGDEAEVDETDCFFVGFGLRMKEVYEPRMQQRRDAVLDHTSCQRKWADVSIPPETVCVSGDAVDFCREDIDFVSPFGSPFVCSVKNGEDWHQIGVLNWVVNSCRNPSNPVVFSKVSPYLEWIKKTTA